ncbi:MAG: peptide deformylase [Ruminococcaceae bacterium]|nr:peptide deformylase [Oscillospiraceae bacterium]
MKKGLAMALREIVKYGDDILRKKCRPVTAFDEKLWTLLDDMKETMEDAKGAGLAAPQVGILRRVCVINVHDEHGTIELVNPEIIATEGAQTGGEGCLSLPGEWHEVERPVRATVKAQDRNGKEFTITGEGLLARALCHETDHLDGVLFIDKMKKEEL